MSMKYKTRTFDYYVTSAKEAIELARKELERRGSQDITLYNSTQFQKDDKGWSISANYKQEDVDIYEAENTRRKIRILTVSDSFKEIEMVCKDCNHDIGINFETYDIEKGFIEVCHCVRCAKNIPFPKETTCKHVIDNVVYRNLMEIDQERCVSVFFNKFNEYRFNPELDDYDIIELINNNHNVVDKVPTDEIIRSLKI